MPPKKVEPKKADIDEKKVLRTPKIELKPEKAFHERAKPFMDK